jgi:hypothetical protein
MILTYNSPVGETIQKANKFSAAVAFGRDSAKFCCFILYESPGQRKIALPAAARPQSGGLVRLE